MSDRLDLDRDPKARDALEYLIRVGLTPEQYLWACESGRSALIARLRDSDPEGWDRARFEAETGERAADDEVAP